LQTMQLIITASVSSRISRLYKFYLELNIQYVSNKEIYLLMEDHISHDNNCQDISNVSSHETGSQEHRRKANT
jgi:hypothetical protein